LGTVPAKRVRVPWWEAVADLVSTGACVLLASLLVFGVLSWGWAITGFFVVTAAHLVLQWYASTLDSLAPGEWIEYEWPRWALMPSDRTTGLIYVGVLLTIGLLLVIATVVKALA
jgi:hypothetical protein